MTVFIDPHGHLVADSKEELHAFAQRIGLKQEWFQDRPRLWHYDCTTLGMRDKARRAGAVLVPPREILRVLRDG